MLHNDLDTVCEWADRWQLKFNVPNCQVIHFGRKTTGIEPSYYMHGEPIEEVCSTKDLGVVFSNDMKVSLHCRDRTIRYTLPGRCEMQHQLTRSKDVWREGVGTRWTFSKTDSLQVQLAATCSDPHLSTIGDDLRTTKVGAAAPGELHGELRYVKWAKLLKLIIYCFQVCLQKFIIVIIVICGEITYYVVTVYGLHALF